MKHNSKMFSWLNEKLEIKNTMKYGRGVFAKADINKGEVLIVMGGYVCDTSQENALGRFAVNYNMDISEEHSFCPTCKDDLDLMPQHLVNHSCEPNAGFRDQCMLVAIRDIKIYGEICYDYAFIMFSSKNSKHHFQMKCGATGFMGGFFGQKG